MTSPAPLAAHEPLAAGSLSAHRARKCVGHPDARRVGAGRRVDGHCLRAEGLVIARRARCCRRGSRLQLQCRPLRAASDGAALERVGSGARSGEQDRGAARVAGERPNPAGRGVREGGGWRPCCSRRASVGRLGLAGTAGARANPVRAGARLEPPVRDALAGVALVA